MRGLQDDGPITFHPSLKGLSVPAAGDMTSRVITQWGLQPSHPEAPWRPSHPPASPTAPRPHAQLDQSAAHRGRACLWNQHLPFHLGRALGGSTASSVPGLRRPSCQALLHVPSPPLSVCMAPDLSCPQGHWRHSQTRCRKDCMNVQHEQNVNSAPPGPRIG